MLVRDRYVDRLSGIIIEDPDLLEWIRDPLIARMFGVGQLGLSRERPTKNSKTRGEHCAAVALLGMAVAIKNGFSIDDARRAFVYGLYHDPHPAGGDGIKLALGINEVSVAEKYFFGDEVAMKRFELRCVKWGWDSWQINKEVLAVINRKLPTPMGNLIHGISKKRADLDFLAYTVGDLAYGSKFARMISEMPSECYSKGELTDCNVILSLATFGIENARILGGGELGELDPIRSHNFHLEDFKILDNFKWDEQAEMWYMNNELAAHFVVASAMLHNTIYFHPGTQGPETMLAMEIDRLGIKSKLAELAMMVDDNGLKKELGKYGLEYWVTTEAHDGWIYGYVGDYGDNLPPGVFRFRPPIFNYRLDTSVYNEVNKEIRPFSLVRPDIVGFIRQMFGEGGEEMVLVDTLFDQRPKI